MKISTKGRYATRAMLDLALNSASGPVSLKDIALRQEISEGYLENLMSLLLAQGLVRSIRGKHGGFLLAKAPEEIRLDEVICTMEGSLAPVPCVDDPGRCNRSDSCVTLDIWGMLKRSMIDVLSSVTLHDMVEMHERKASQEEELMYYI
jgi:Rrf2 family protein